MPTCVSHSAFNSLSIRLQGGAWTRGWRLFLLAILLLGAAPLYAQGCTACRDATAGSAPRAREGLRRAIMVLGTPAAGICVAVFFLARRVEQRRDC